MLFKRYWLPGILIILFLWVGFHGEGIWSVEGIVAQGPATPTESLPTPTGEPATPTTSPSTPTSEPATPTASPPTPTGEPATPLCLHLL